MPDKISDLDDFEGQDDLVEKFGDDTAKALAGGWSATKLVGTAVQVPGDNATDEERRTFYTRIGAPEKEDGYTIPDGVQGPLKSELEVYRRQAHESGMTALAWDGFVSRSREFHKEVAANQDAAMKDAFGADHEKKVGTAERVVGELLGADKKGSMAAQLKDPSTVALLNAMAPSVLDDISPDAATTPPGGFPDKDAIAKEKRQILYSDAYKDPAHPDYTEVRTRLGKLFEKDQTPV